MNLSALSLALLLTAHTPVGLIHDAPGPVAEHLSKAQTADDRLIGRYTLDPEASDDPAEAVETMVQSVGRLMRGRARSRLNERLQPAESMEIQADGEAYLIGVPGDDPFRVVPGGEPVERTSPDGEEVQISTVLEGESLVMTIQMSQGTRTQTLTPEGDGLRVTLVYDLEIHAEPVTVVLVYRRDGS